MSLGLLPGIQCRSCKLGESDKAGAIIGSDLHSQGLKQCGSPEDTEIVIEVSKDRTQRLHVDGLDSRSIGQALQCTPTRRVGVTGDVEALQRYGQN